MFINRYFTQKKVHGLLFTLLILGLASNPAAAFSVLPAQPGANTSFRATDVYTLPGGAQMSSFLNPVGIEEIIRGGTGTFLSTLQATFPTWTFNPAANDLAGDFNIQNYYACGTGTADCGTEQGIPAAVNGSFIDITYTPGVGDPTQADNDLHWIQRLYSNHDIAGGHGIPSDKIDIRSGFTSGSLGLCDNNPYYDCGYFAGETFFVDRPSRGDNEDDHVWGAELYLVEQTDTDTVTVYNGVKWGWGNTDSDVRTFTAPPSGVTFNNPTPGVPPATATGIGTNSITWGDAVDGSFSSGLSITPQPFELTPLIGEPFLLGTISFSNGTIVSGSGLDSVDMSIETVIDVAALDIAGMTIDDTRLVSMINTVNTCDANVAGDCSIEESRESADIVAIPPAADLTDIPETFPSFSELGNEFHVFEESSATATLIGRITEAKIEADGDDDGLLPPGPNALPPGKLAPQNFVLEILGFGGILEGDGLVEYGFITMGGPEGSGDLDADDIITHVDIDKLTSGIRNGVVSASFDIDGSGTVDINDLLTLVEVKLKTRFGDSDLNQVVNFADFANLSRNFGARGTGWQEGDFNGDNVTNFADFALLSNNFGTRWGSDAMIPEPTSFALLCGVCILVRRSRQRR